MKDSENVKIAGDTKSLIEQSRQNVAQAVNAEIALLYWKVGKRINEEVLGNEGAEYGKQILQSLSAQLEVDYGKGWGEKQLRHCMQFAGIKEAQLYLQRNEGGIIWHTQGSGKSLTMVWLAKWILENNPKARLLIVTDRTELDEQIEGVFNGVGETIVRTRSGADLMSKLNQTTPRLLCIRPTNPYCMIKA